VSVAIKKKLLDAHHERKKADNASTGVLSYTLFDEGKNHIYVGKEKVTSMRRQFSV
jgi:hypothetical protein